MCTVRSARARARSRSLYMPSLSSITTQRRARRTQDTARTRPLSSRLSTHTLQWRLSHCSFTRHIAVRFSRAPSPTQSLVLLPLSLSLARSLWIQCSFPTRHDTHAMKCYKADKKRWRRAIPPPALLLVVHFSALAAVADLADSAVLAVPRDLARAPRRRLGGDHHRLQHAVK